MMRRDEENDEEEEDAEGRREEGGGSTRESISSELITLITGRYENTIWEDGDNRLG